MYERVVFDAGEAARRQDETAAALGVPRELTLDLAKGVSMKLVLIPAGQSGWDVVERPFYMGVFEVTRGQFAAFVQDSKYPAGAGDRPARLDEDQMYFRHIQSREAPPPADEHPVVNISWNDADVFCRWLSRRTGRRVGLPSEVQWVYAARAGVRTRYLWGDNPDDGKGWCNAADASLKKLSTVERVYPAAAWDDGYAATAPVGRFKPNAFALYDVDGNVSEFCRDAYGSDELSEIGLYGGALDAYARAARGGNWSTLARMTHRVKCDPFAVGAATGFRVVVEIPQAAQAGRQGGWPLYSRWPFDSAEAMRRQDETAKALGLEKVFTLRLADGAKMRLVLIPAGKFTMGSFGSQPSLPDQRPPHEVTITEPFYIGMHEVTRGQFAALMEDFRGYRTEASARGRFGPASGVLRVSPGFEQTDDHPVVNVTWNDATVFCRWFSRKTGQAIGLPTEAQWEYACRAGSDGRFPWGDAAGKALFNGPDRSTRQKHPTWDVFDWDDGYPFTSPVGEFEPNAFGLHDTIGNVLEWCQDWYGEDYYGQSEKADPPGHYFGTDRVVRGGSWAQLLIDHGCAVRDKRIPATDRDYLGFRVVMKLPQPRPAGSSQPAATPATQSPQAGASQRAP